MGWWPEKHTYVRFNIRAYIIKDAPDSRSTQPATQIYKERREGQFLPNYEFGSLEMEFRLRR